MGYFDRVVRDKERDRKGRVGLDLFGCRGISFASEVSVLVVGRLAARRGLRREWLSLPLSCCGVKGGPSLLLYVMRAC